MGVVKNCRSCKQFIDQDQACNSDKCYEYSDYEYKFSIDSSKFLNNSSGRKDDNGKLQLNLIPPEVIEMLGEIYTYGANKYGAGNWEKGFEEGRLIAAGRRHDLAIAKGERLDPDSGLSHAAHAAWNYLTDEILKRREEIDEYKEIEKDK